MKYILGGGITGLIFAYYNPDYKIITTDIGGQMGSSFALGPRYLHKTKHTEELIKELGMPLDYSTIKVGYISDEGWVDSPDQEFRKAYFKKSRGTNSLEGFDPTSMNGNKNSFDIIKVDFHKFIEKLKNKIGKERFTVEQIRHINVKKHRIDTYNGNTFKYNHLISSIPLNIFDSVSTEKINLELKSLPMTYCYVKKSSLFDMKNFDFVYDIRDIKSHRITNELDGVVLDHIGVYSAEWMKSIYKNDYIDSKILYSAQIISMDSVPEIEDVKFVGRYGTWNRTWKTEKVVEEAKNFNA